MKSILSLITLGLLVGFAAPAFADDPVPTTKEDCDKTADMEWDADAGKCVEESPGG